MTQFKLSFHPFNEPLKKPLSIYSNSIDFRQGLYVFLSNLEDLILGIGEISPLPFLNNESYDDIALYCRSLEERVVDVSFSSDSYALDWTLFSDYPSFQFGLESACIMACSQVKSQRIPCHYFMPLTSLDETLSGYNFVKCKIGILDLEYEISCIQSLISQYPHIQFRFDANSRFSLSQACRFFSALPKSAVDYIEDPCENVLDYDSFYNKTGIPYALDFSLAECEQADSMGLKTIVIKPSSIGSLDNVKKLITQFPSQNIVFSSSYETRVGLNGIANYVIALASYNVHGLDTEHVFSYSLSDRHHHYWNPLDVDALNSWVFRRQGT